MRWWFLVLVAAFLAGAALAWRWSPPGRTVTASVAGFDLADVRELGELRLAVAELCVLRREEAYGHERRLDVVIPVRLVLGIDLSRLTAVRRADAWEVALPPVRVLSRSSDPARWTVWRCTGPLQTSDERVSLAQLAELLAFGEADREAERIGLHALARGRARAAITAWAGPVPVRFLEHGEPLP